MPYIAQGSLVFTGFGDSGSMRFYTPSGVSLGQPVSAPDPGTNTAGIVALPSGRIAIIGGDAPNFPNALGGVFNSDFTFHAEIASISPYPDRSIARDDAGNFYAVASGNTIFRFDEDAALLDSWTVSAAAQQAIGVNGAGTIAYVSVNDGVGGININAWDLVGNTSLGLFKKSGTVSTNGLLVLSNGEVLIAWRSLGPPIFGEVKRYSAAGSVLGTYALPGTQPTPYVITSGFTDATFWVGYDDQSVTTPSGVRIVEFDVATGAILHNFTPADGAFEFDGPFCVLRVGIGPPTTLPPPTVIPPIPNPCCTPAPGVTPGNVPPSVGGWTPRCTGGGTVPTQADIVDDEDWTVVSSPPCFRVTIHLTKYPASLGTLTLRWSQRPLADAQWSEGRLLTIGDVGRSCVDQDGNPQLSSWSVEVSDDDHYVRTLLETTGTKFFYGRECDLEMLSEAGRAAGLDWRVVGRGQIASVQTPAAHRATFGVSDLIGSKFSGYDLDRMIGVPIGDEHIHMVAGTNRPIIKPSGTIGKLIYPIVVGEISDYGAKAMTAAGLVDAAKGMLPVIDTGDYDVTGAETPPVFATPPVITYSGVVGAGGGAMLYYGATLVTPYGESAMSNIVSVNGASVRNLSNYKEISGTFDCGDPALLTNVNKVRIWVGNGSTMVAWLDIAYTNGVGVFGYLDGAAPWPGPTRDELDLWKFATPPGGGAQINPNVWGRLLVSQNCVNIDDVYYSDLSTTTDPKRVKADATAAGVDYMTADSPSWPHPTRYLDLTNSAGETIRGTYLYVRGPRLVAHRDGSVPIAVNACMDSAGDGTSGVTIDEVFKQGQWFVNEIILKNAGTGYRNGNYGPLEAFANGDPQVQTSAWAAAQAITVARIGGRGYLGAWTIHEPITVREWVQRFCLSFDCRLTVNSHGQIIPVLVNDLAVPTVGRPYREWVDEAQFIDAPYAESEIENRITYAYDYDPDSKALRATAHDDGSDLSVEDPDSIAAHVPGGVVGNSNPRGVHQGPVQELLYSRSETTAQDSRARRLLRNRKAPRYVTHFAPALRGLEDDLGDQIRFTHRSGKGTTGDNLTPLCVLEHVLRASYGEIGVEMTGMDIARIASSGGLTLPFTLSPAAVLA